MNPLVCEINKPMPRTPTVLSLFHILNENEYYMVVFESCSFKPSEKLLHMLEELVFWKLQICTSDIYRYMSHCSR